jgi:regulator of sirC expression with transglutaminase-like and TPR domain
VIEGGLIATAHHVIGDGREIRVELPGGKLVPVVEVFASSSRLDLAILRVADLQLPALSLSADDRTPQGREVVALGHPEGFRNSIVSGVISGHQDIEGVEMLQLAMSIERGNSGGPVLDRQGAVVGIVTRKSALQDKLGFAVPVRLLRELKADPNPVLMSRWSTIGALDPAQWTVLFGGNWRQRAGRLQVSGEGAGFGGRTLCVSRAEVPAFPYDIRVLVRLEDESGAAGLVFHSDEGDRHYGFYPSAGNLRLTRFDGPDVNSWTILHNQPHDAWRAGQWNTLTVRVQEDVLQCFVNEALVVESRDVVLPKGRPGLASFRGTSAEFRRFEVGRDLLPVRADSQGAARLREFADGMRADLPVQQDGLDALLPLGEPAIDFMAAEAERLQQKSRRLKLLSEDLHRAAVRRELVAALRPADSSAEPDLLSCALLVARIDNADVDPAGYVQRVQRMAGEIRGRLPADSTESVRLAALDRWLFEELGFRGSRFEYDTASNSYLNEVIDDREGIPISLCVLYMELAKRLDLRVVGVGLPGHFVVRFEPQSGGDSQLIDVFERGRRLSDEDVRRIIAAAGFPDQPRFREARTTPEIIERMVNNLLSLAEAERADERVLGCLETLAAIVPANVEYRAKRLEMRARTGRLGMAIADAEWFISERPDGVDVERVRQLRQTLQDQLEQQQKAQPEGGSGG